MQTEWKIVYTDYKGVAKKAVNFISKEVGKYIIREYGKYKIHVLPCEKEGCVIEKNAFLIGVYSQSPLIQKFVCADEIKEGGFLVKVAPNPDVSEGQLVILTAHSETELFYAAVSFVDDYIPLYSKTGYCIFEKQLPEYSYSESPDNKTRSIFTWGHSFNDYRQYIDNMARLKFNELIIWNDYLPINIGDIIEYAHSYGIRVILGYSWGWKEIGTDVGVITDETLDKLKTMIIRDYRDIYAPVECDGIYFQTFTERTEDKIGDKLIARVVTDMVNEVAEKLWEITPDLRLIFGLHASSVVNHLDEIERVDSRIEILWEDCGQFPYGYLSYVDDRKKYEETLEFTKKILSLRSGKGAGLVFKGIMMLNWTSFVHQAGPFVMGDNTPEISEHDRKVRAEGWRRFSADWIQHGKDAYNMMKVINESKSGQVNMCLAGTLDGGMYLPYALCGQMYRTLGTSYADTLKKVSARPSVTLD